MARGPSVTDYLEAGLKAASLRGKIISNNVANMDTPGFRRSEVRFEQLLAKAMTGGKEADLDAVAPKIIQPQNTGLNEQGNDQVGPLLRAINQAISGAHSLREERGDGSMEAGLV